jgi:hypothetical protein
VLGRDWRRQATAYVPQGPPEAIVFADDGQLVSQWGGVLEAAAAPGRLRRGLLRLTRRGIPAARRDARIAAAHVPRRRHTGAVLPGCYRLHRTLTLEQETSTIDVPIRIQINWNRLAHLIRQ